MLNKYIFRRQKQPLRVSQYNPFGDPMWQHPTRVADLMHQQIFGLHISLGLLVVRQNWLLCLSWADLQRLMVPSNMDLAHSILISLGLPNISLSLSQIGRKAVQKKVSFCDAFILYFLFKNSIS